MKGKERLKVTLNLKPVEHIITHNPSVWDRDYDVTHGGRYGVAKEVVEHLSPAEERARAILEELEKKGMISLTTFKISTKGLKSMFNRSKKPSVILHLNDGQTRMLAIDEGINHKTMCDFLGIDTRRMRE